MQTSAPTMEERELYGLTKDQELFTHEDFVRYHKWLRGEVKRLEERAKSRPEDSSKGKYEAERARALRTAHDALLDIWHGRNQYRYR